MEYRGETDNTKSYTESERLAALEFAAVHGIAATARKLSVTRKTIHRWRDRYPKYWSDLRAGDPAAHRRGFAHSLEDLAERYTAAEHDLLDRVEEDLIPKADPKEAAALLKAMGSNRQAAVAGARTLSGEPEVVEHQINFPALEAAMERLLEGAQPPEPPEPPTLQVRNEADVDPVPADT